MTDHINQKFNANVLGFLREKNFLLWISQERYTSTNRPGYSLDGILRFTGVKLILMRDIEKYQFIESTTRDCISMIFRGYAEANKTFLKSYDASKSTSYIIYLNAKNWYGHSMMHLLTTEILEIL